MLAIIGGTGLYTIEGLETLEELTLNTPYGAPSAPIVKAKYGDQQVLFLPRHGSQHQFLPHEINYRANIYALKQAGARHILGFSATGSLREDIKPGHLAIPSQYFDFIKGNRDKTFFGEGVAAHVSTAEPSSALLTDRISAEVAKMQAGGEDITLHTGKTYACVDGPRLGTKAESHFMRQIGCDLVGMTNVPEAFLAREAQLCYATVGIVTDFDCWMDDPQYHVTVAEVIQRYGASLTLAKRLLLNFLKTPFDPSECPSRTALAAALLTPDAAIPEHKRELIDLLKL